MGTSYRRWFDGPDPACPWRATPADRIAACACRHVYVSGRYTEAFEWALNTLRERARVPAALRLVGASHPQLGNTDVARTALDELLAVSPRASLALVKQMYHFERPEDIKRYLDGLREAGMPE